MAFPEIVNDGMAEKDANDWRSRFEEAEDQYHTNAQSPVNSRDGNRGASTEVIECYRECDEEEPPTLAT